MDLLNLENDALYFDEPLLEEAQECLQQAAGSYGKERAERLLLKAYFLEPEHPMVLVALYRYYYYQHRLEESLQVAERVLKVLGKHLKLPGDWRDLNEDWLGNGVLVSMSLVRFYMLALKGAGYLELRLGNYESGLARLEKVAELDAKDRFGARALIGVAQRFIHGDAEAASL